MLGFDNVVVNIKTKNTYLFIVIKIIFNGQRIFCTNILGGTYILDII